MNKIIQLLYIAFQAGNYSRQTYKTFIAASGAKILVIPSHKEFTVLLNDYSGPLYLSVTPSTMQLYVRPENYDLSNREYVAKLSSFLAKAFYSHQADLYRELKVITKKKRPYYIFIPYYNTVARRRYPL